MFRISSLPARADHWHRVIVDDGPKMRGTVDASLSVDLENGGELSLWLDLSPRLTDESGSTVYRTADPDAGEIQTGSAVIADALTINGVAYDGSIHLHRDADGGRWTTRSSGAWSVYRAGGFIGSGPRPTDAANSKIHTLVLAIAEAIATPENIHAARVRAAEYADSRAASALAEAQKAADAAAAQLAAIRAESVPHDGAAEGYGACGVHGCTDCV